MTETGEEKYKRLYESSVQKFDTYVEQEGKALVGAWDQIADAKRINNLLNDKVAKLTDHAAERDGQVAMLAATVLERNAENEELFNENQFLGGEIALRDEAIVARDKENSDLKIENLNLHAVIDSLKDDHEDHIAELLIQFSNSNTQSAVSAIDSVMRDSYYM